jgi:hypothetical protein
MSIINEIIWSEYYKPPPKLIPITGTPFYIGALNLLYGLSKSGKSHSLAELLHSADLQGKTVVWLDKDYNINPETLKLLSQFKHVNENVDKLCEELLQLSSLQDFILVFDSLKDFSEDLDTNTDAQKAMQHIRQFTKLGATVIVIAHGTEKRTNEGKVIGFKIKGNSETIQSKCDCIIRFEKKESNTDYGSMTMRKFIPDRMRISNASTQTILVYDKAILSQAIQRAIMENEGITHRELIKKFSSNMEAAIKDLEDIAYQIEHTGNKRVVQLIPEKSMS